MSHDLFFCDNPRCGRVITVADMRVRYVPATRDEPGHDDPACVHCSPNDDDLKRARDARNEQRISEAREL